MLQKYHFQKVFVKATYNQLTAEEINWLVDNAYKLAVTTLRLLHKRIHKLIVHEQLTIDNIAIDAIAPLFIKNENGILNQISDVFTSWKPQIDSEVDAIYFFNKLVGKRVDQHISFLLRESDPFFSKILDSINYLIKKNGFRKVHYLGSTYIISLDCETIAGNVMCHQDIELIPALYFLDKKKIIENVLEYIITKTLYFPAIPLNPLIFRIKVLTFEMYKPDASNNHFPNFLETESIVKNALNKTYEKLDSLYVSKGKLSIQEKLKFEKAISDMAKDLCDGGLNPGLYHYLKNHFDSLSKDEYKFKYHNILEYLLKLLKDNIAAQL